MGIQCTFHRNIAVMVTGKGPLRPLINYMKIFVSKCIRFTLITVREFNILIQNHLGPISCTPLIGTVLGVKRSLGHTH